LVNRLCSLDIDKGIYQLNTERYGLKIRLGPNGLHIFDRRSGLNILFDEVRADESVWATAPRQVSIALTNLCDLHCAYCYAPKHQAMLSVESAVAWLKELDQGGCMGIGFGGGEPTLHPQFAEICKFATEETQMAVTFTTHGHRLLPTLLDRIAGYVHFIRVSVDGVKETYEALRGRRFPVLLERLREARRLAPLGINVIVNESTIQELDSIVEVAQEIDASELLLLPQQATDVVEAASDEVRSTLEHWVCNYKGNVRLAVSEVGSEQLPTCNPLPLEIGLRAYAHIDASGLVRTSSYSRFGVGIGTDGVMAAINKLAKIG
jgi:MoaA/NifB/PqqE/SkfB family radical SAM enzyme